MNILLINHYAGSPEMGMEFRPFYFAREWVKMGHHVDIAAADYSHLRMKNPEISKDFQTETIDGITYHWIKTGRYEGNGAARALTMFQFVGKLWRNAGEIARKWKPDVVITSSTYPLDTYAGQRIAKKSGAGLIHEVHDMWPLTPMELNGMPKYHPFIMMLQFAENSFCKKSDYVVSLLPHAKKYLMAHGMAEKKFVPIVNGIDLEEWNDKTELPEIANNLLKEMREKYGFLICFFGSHTQSYALEYLIDAVKQFDKKEIGLIFVGNGNEKKHLKIRSHGWENIRFLDPIPKRSIPTLLDVVDSVYIGAVNNRMFRFGICMNKLFDAMMGGKPILYAVNAPNNYIEEYRCGITVRPEDTEDLVRGIKELLSEPEKERAIMGENGKKAVMRHFNYRVLAKQFERVFIAKYLTKCVSTQGYDSQ